MISLDERRTFTLAFANPAVKSSIASAIESHIKKTTLFFAEDGSEALFKIESFPPHICILDGALPKKTGFELVEFLLSKDFGKNIAFIIVSEIPDNELFVDQVVTGQVQFLRNPNSEDQIVSNLTRSLNFVAQSDNSEYKLHFLGPKDILFNEGDIAHSVFILKSGTLDVFLTSDSKRKDIAQISSGEFVGEMAYFNHDKRSASVQAVTDCELIEIPIGKLDTVLFSKPAWAKALMHTLTRRIKNSNSLVKTILKKET